MTNVQELQTILEKIETLPDDAPLQMYQIKEMLSLGGVNSVYLGVALRGAGWTYKTVGAWVKGQ